MHLTPLPRGTVAPATKRDEVLKFEKKTTEK